MMLLHAIDNGSCNTKILFVHQNWVIQYPSPNNKKKCNSLNKDLNMSTKQIY